MRYTLANFNAFRDACHNASRDAGWWKGTERYPMHIDGVYPDSDYEGAEAPDRYVIPTKLCLVHSEISEAYEGYMSGANDDHISALPSALVEFGDTLIRIGDLAGYLDIDLSSAIMLVLQADHIEEFVSGQFPFTKTVQHAFNRLHVWTSAAMESYRKGNKPDTIIAALSGVAANLARIVILCDLIAAKNEWDLPAAAEAKMAYNAVRLDHKAEVRALDDGKRF